MSPTQKTAPAPSPACRAEAGPLLVALLSGDEGAALCILRRAREEGLDLACIARVLLEPALAQVGEMWYRGEVNEAEEHLATSLAGRALSRIAATIPPPSPGAPRIVFSCLAGEFHELGTRVATEIAREAGWDAENLGANVPRPALLRFVAQRRPRAVGLSLSLAAHIPECVRTVAQIRAEAPGTAVLVGGGAFRRDPALHSLVQADAVHATVEELRDWLRGNLPRAHPDAAAPAPPCCLPASFHKKLARQR